MYRALRLPNFWLLPVLMLILLAIFATLFDNGALLGEATWEKNYLHEFFHDGRHLLSVPCH